MRISNNLMAYNAQNKLNVNNNNVADSVRKLSSGLKISRAGDDAAGLAISEKMRAQIKGLDMASKNSQDAISLIQTAEGALNESHSILQRMRELAVQSSSDTNEDSVDRAALNSEYEALTLELDDIANDTQFNGKKLLNGDLAYAATVTTAADGSQLQVGVAGVESIEISGFDSNDGLAMSIVGGAYVATLNDGSTQATAAAGSGTAAGAQTLNFDFGDGRTVSIGIAAGTAAGSIDVANVANGLDFTVAGSGAQIQTGANEGENLTISINSMKASDLGVGGDSSQTVTASQVNDITNAQDAIDTLDTALNQVSTARAGLGAMQNRLEHKIKNLDTSSENLQAAESRIRDLDMAAEMTEFTSNNILSQAATSMLAQANSLPQNVLKLLG